MAQKPEILIHTALFSEARPIIDHFGLSQYETRPFKVFRGGRIVLVVSGVGREKTRGALELIYSRNHFKTALNIGTAGCNDTGISIGSMFCTYGKPVRIPILPLQTFDSPVTHLDSNETCLVDMEGRYFYELSVKQVPVDRVFVLKVVSDYLNDTIRSSGDIGRLIGDSIRQWEFLVDSAFPYLVKLESVIEMTPFNNLDSSDRESIRQASLAYRFSHQELKQIIEMALDFRMWGELSISECLNRDFATRKEAFGTVKRQWEDLKRTPKSYSGFKGISDIGEKKGKRTVRIDRETPGFGRCPVASPRTRCCNLLTLDAVEGCGYDCSYCSIRYFYGGDSIGIDEDFPEKLKSIHIDPGRTYHIGTGQSSDSLMWGNKAGILDAILDFAGDHPNVILELKTKSGNIGHLLSREVPANVITTWSLNTDVIIENEEHFTASLEGRLNAAERMADKGCLIGFHFHPMVYYDEWKTDYGKLFTTIVSRFRPEDTALVSLGTLTFIKPVIRNMRDRNMRSKILQMPLEDAEGKFSYPLELKQEMFGFAYESFIDWHDKVFFYLCMEDSSLWPEVFGYDYSNNEEFEAAMIGHYGRKIREKTEKL